MLKIVLPIGLGLFLGYAYLDASIRDSYSGMWNSDSSAQARQTGILLREYTVKPRVIEFENYRAEFTDCWVEECTRTRHRLILFKEVTKSGGRRFVLNYQGQRVSPDPDSVGGAMLVPGQQGVGLDLAESEYAPQPAALAYRQFTNISLPTNGNDTIYFSIIRRWKDPRNYLIKVYPKAERQDSSISVEH